MAEPAGMDNAANKAFAAAQARIAKAIREGRTEISFDLVGFRALTHIPDEIAGINRLTRISLDNTKVSDLSPIAGLTELKELYLDQTEVSDLVPIAGMTRLEVLFLRKTGISDLRPITGLTGLQGLALNGTPVSDLSPIAGITGLQVLSLDQNGVSDLSPITSLTELKELYLNQTGVSDLSPITGMTGLQTLWLNQTGVSDLRPLINMKNLGNRESLGLGFTDTPAVRLDENLARLAEIEDDKDRAKQVIAYLKTLPPWPEPLPWLAGAGAQAGVEEPKEQIPLVPSPVPGRGLVPPVGLKRLTMADARNLLQQGHPILRDRCQRVMAEIADAEAMLAMRIPNDETQLAEHRMLERTLTLSKAALEGIHDAIPADLSDQAIDEKAAGRLRDAFDQMLGHLQNAAAYIDRKDHSPTYGGLMKLGLASSVAILAALAPGISIAAAIPVVYACLYGPEAAKSLKDIGKLTGGGTV